MPETRKPILVVGSINIDLVARTEHIPGPGETVAGTEFATYPGGKGANQAVSIARLGYPVRLIGRLGNDAFGSQLKEHLHGAGVELSGVITTEGASGVAVILVSEAGENCIVVAAGANAHLSPSDLDDNLAIIRSAGMILTQLEIPLETVQYLAALCTREDIPLMLDPAPARALPADLLQAVSWFTPNESEAAFFAGPGSVVSTAAGPQDLAEVLLTSGLSHVVLKRGARGAYLAGTDGLRASVSAFPVEAVDTTAAGDCFNGAFATALSMGQEPAAAARFAAAAAALSVTRRGAQSSMPSAAEVEALLMRVSG